MRAARGGVSQRSVFSFRGLGLRLAASLEKRFGSRHFCYSVCLSRLPARKEKKNSDMDDESYLRSYPWKPTRMFTYA